MRYLETGGYNPLVPQVAGDHYKNRGIQPVEYIAANELNFFQGNIVKYITRHKDKNGIDDLAKVIHYTFLECYFEYGIEGSTELYNKVCHLLGIALQQEDENGGVNVND